MDQALRALLTETVQIAAHTGQDAYGTPTYGALTSYPARLEDYVRRITTATGAERVSQTRVFLEGTVPLDLRDQLTLPDGSTPPLLSLRAVRDLDGSVSHWEALC